MGFRWKVLLSLAISWSASAIAGENVPQSFTLDGTLYSDAVVGTPLIGTGTLKIQIVDSAETCVLYEESQSYDTTSTNGKFNIQVGEATSPVSKRTAGDSGHRLSDVFLNDGSLITGKLVSNGTACTGNATAGLKRFVRITVTPTAGTDRVLSPNLPLTSIPSAMVAENAQSLSGKTASQFVGINTTSPAVLSQSNLENIFSTTNYPKLTDLLSGNSSSYVKAMTNNSIQIPSSGTTPTSPLAGQMWYESGVLKYWDGSAAQPVGSGGGGMTSVTAGTGLSGGTISTTGTIALSTAVQNGLWSGDGTNVWRAGGNVGIGTGAPGFKLELSGTSSTSDRKIGINGTQAVYLPDQTDFAGSFFVGNGGGALSHTSTIEGQQNTGVGIGALQANTLGFANTATGNLALSSSTTGAYNTASGFSALASLTIGSGNTANGALALTANTFGTNNTANGLYALSSNTIGDRNTANGSGSLGSNTVGAHNTADGSGSLASNTTGNNNTAIGYGALTFNTAKSESTAIGNFSMMNADDSVTAATSYNTALGAYSLQGSTTPSDNTGIKNTALGHSALMGMTSGSGNIGVGYNAGSAITTGSNNVVIGSDTGSSIATASNYILLNDGAGNRRLTIDSNGDVGIGTTAPGTALDLASKTDAIALPSGTTAQRPSSPVNGYTRYNTDMKGVEAYINSSWQQVGAGASPTASEDGKSLRWNNTLKQFDWFTAGAAGAGIGTLNGLTATSQNFAIGTGGLAPNFDSNASTHTLHIPMASTASVTAGLISKTEYDTFNSKLGTATSFSGDVSGTYNSISVDKIKGKAVSAAPTTAGQVLRYDGTNFVPNFISMFDLRSTVTGSAAFGGVGCLNNQTLTWTSATDNLACSDISLSASQITGVLPVANGGTGTNSLSGAFVINGGQNGAVSAGTNDANDLTLKTNSSARVTVTSGGNVGIGTASPSGLLHVYSGTTSSIATIESAAGASALVIAGTQGTNRLLDFRTGSNSRWRFAVSGNETGSDAGGDLSFLRTSDSGTMTSALTFLRSNGSVGIGTATPGSKLHVYDSNSASTTVASFRSTNANYGGFTLGDAGTSTSPGIFSANNDLTLWTGGSQRVRIDSSGNVGMGTMSPGALLHLQKSGAPADMIVATSDPAGDGLQPKLSLEYYDTGLGGGGYPSLVLKSATGSPGAPAVLQQSSIVGKIDFNGRGSAANLSLASITARAAGTGSFSTTNRDTELTFATAVGNSAPATRMIIDPSGKVGIGTTTPTATLDVNGTIKATGFSGPMTPTSMSVGAGTNGAPSMTFSGDTDTGFYDASSNDTISVGVGGSKVFDFTSTGLASPTSGGASIGTGVGTTGAPTFSFTGDTDTGWWHPAADTMAASTAGAERMRIDSSGKIGIGTTSPTTLFDVQGGLGSIATSSYPISRVFNSSATQGNAQTTANMAVMRVEAGNGTVRGDFLAVDNNGPGTFYNSSGAYLGTRTNHPLTFQTNTTDRMTLDTSGNVGIGTASPNANLEIYSAAASPSIRLSYNSTTSYAQIYESSANQMKVYQYSVTGSPLMDFNPVAVDGTSSAYLRMFRDTSTTGNSGLQLFHGDGSGTVDTQLSIHGANSYINAAGGNVGIGTTAPAAKVSIARGSSPTSVTIANEYLHLGGNYQTVNGLHLIGFGYTSPETYPNAYMGFQETSAAGSGKGDLVFGARNVTTDSAPSEMMRITGAGNIGIGTTAPNAKLEINGSGANTASRILSGNAANFSVFQVGRTTSEMTLGVTSIANNWVTGTAIGDAFLRSESTGKLFLSSGGTQSLVIDSGNVGIGSSAPTAALDVNGKARSTAQFAYAAADPNLSTTSNGTYVLITGSGASIAVQTGDVVRAELLCDHWATASGYSHYMQVNWTSGAAVTNIMSANQALTNSTAPVSGVSVGIWKATADGTAVFSGYHQINAAGSGWVRNCRVIATIIGKQ